MTDTPTGAIPTVVGTALALVAIGYVLRPLLRTTRNATASTYAPLGLSQTDLQPDVTSMSPTHGDGGTEGFDVRNDAGAIDEAEALIAKARVNQRECPNCGPRPEPDAKFCSNCGSALPGICRNCGARLRNADARFCSECGTAQPSVAGS